MVGNLESKGITLCLVGIEAPCGSILEDEVILAHVGFRVFCHLSHSPEVDASLDPGCAAAEVGSCEDAALVERKGDCSGRLAVLAEVCLGIMRGDRVHGQNSVLTKFLGRDDHGLDTDGVGVKFNGAVSSNGTI